MTTSGERSTPVGRATALVSAFTDEARLGARTRVALTVVQEELVSNTAAHGGGDPEAPIDVELRLAGDATHLRYKDRGWPFDPGARPAAGLVPQAIRERYQSAKRRVSFSMVVYGPGR